MSQSIFQPTRKKIGWTVLTFFLLLSTTLLGKIPASIDILDLREVPGFIIFVIGGIPILIFDTITNGAFASKGEGFIVFPSLAQISFAIIFDLFFIYLIVCFVTRLYAGRAWKSKRTPAD